MPIKVNPDLKRSTKEARQLTYYTDGLRAGSRFVLSEAITLIESEDQQKRITGLSILDKLYTADASTKRIGISGSPGVGKSTFINYIAGYLASKGEKVAILAIDPASQKTKGSILGDKTRMEEIGSNEMIYIRPSSAKFELGGVADTTKEAIHLCEAAGFDTILIETVGVGQSETAVAQIVDLFCLLVLPGAGDELQGIKRGITELADLVIINKADQSRKELASISQKHYAHSLHLLRPKITNWTPRVLKSSSLEKRGIEKIWKAVETFFEICHESGYFMANRKEQNLNWFQKKFRQLAVEYYLKKEMNLKTFQKLETEIRSDRNNPFFAMKNLYETTFPR
jgi:LAO/AO transport system kinase